MNDYITVIPAREQRQRFARWSLGQQPGGLAMSSHEAWAVPSALFTEVPEELLVGALIDGRPYRAVVEDFEPHGDGYRPVPPAGVVPVDDGAGPESLDFAPLDDADGGHADDAAPADDATEAWGCEDCGRPFATQRGLNRHRTAVHHEGVGK
jgi:hypothetical protein